MNKETVVGVVVVYRDNAWPTQSVATHSHILLENKDKNYPQEFRRNLLKSVRPNVFGTSDFVD